MINVNKDQDESSIMEAMADKLGVKLNVGWCANDGNYYAISPKGASRFNIKTHSWHNDVHALRDIAIGVIRPRWEPEFSDTFYTIDLQGSDEMIVEAFWSGANDIERDLLKNNLVFKTEEQATVALNKILDVLKGES